MSQKGRPRLNPTMSEAEVAVLDLWDDGLGSIRIAERLDLKHDTVLRILDNLAGDESYRDNRRIRKATTSLAARIREVHGVPAA